MSDIPFQNEKIENICISAELIAEFISLFGTSFLPVRANVTDNVQKIRAKVELILVQNSELSMSTIGEYIGKFGFSSVVHHALHYCTYHTYQYQL